MARFRFRLQRVLDYRRVLEKGAKDFYLASRAARIEAENLRDLTLQECQRVAGLKAAGLDAMISREAAILRLKDDAEEMRSVIAVLETDEEKAKKEWLARRTDADAIEKLRERDKEEWVKEIDKKEQAELDEWAVTRKAA